MQGLPEFFWLTLIVSETVKAADFKVCMGIQKPMKNFGISIGWRRLVKKSGKLQGTHRHDH